MTHQTEIICDFCSENLSYSEGITLNYLHLINETAPNVNGYVIDVFMEPILNEDKYFCGLGCLEKWILKEKK